MVFTVVSFSPHEKEEDIKMPLIMVADDRRRGERGEGRGGGSRKRLSTPARRSRDAAGEEPPEHPGKSPC